MKIILLSLAIASSLFIFTGCTSEDEKKNEGLCSGATIDTYNAIGTKVKAGADLAEIQAACANFQSNIGAGSCKASSMKTGQEVMTSYQNVKSTCEAVNEMIAHQQGADKKPSAKKASNASASKKISSLKNGLTLTVRDQSKVNEVLSAKGEFYIQTGKVLRSYTLLSSDLDVPVCSLLSESKSFEVRDKDKIKIISTKQEKGHLRMASKDSNLILSCLKRMDGEEWTLDELSSAFGKMVEFKVNTEE